ncbi:MAG TPA: bifunctional DedA family/phosphatase PAP2 family protein [Nocardioidaceae bacterium]|nr:bifunctional DedA family/phosphatase PAP2 family protein [Nocardioidaceae bacterium]
MLDAVAAHILALPAWVALVVVFALPALESSAFVGFVFPGEIALILGGVLAFQGVVPVWAVLAAGIAGAVLGDSVGYVVGRRYGRRLIDGTVGRWINHDHLDRGERYLAQRGGNAVFLGRFTAALRVMIPGLAGMSRMPYRTFAAYNVAGGLTWGTMCILLGYLGGSSWRRVEHLASRVGLIALGVIVLLVAAGYLLRRAPGGWPHRMLNRARCSWPVMWVEDRFPRQVVWVSQRLDTSRTTGLPLTLLVAVAIGAIWITLGLTQDVLAHEEVALFDLRAHAWLLQHRPDWLAPIMRAATWLGSNAVLLPILVIAAGAGGYLRRSWSPVVDIVVVYGGALILSSVMKEAVHRPRPPAAGWLMHASGLAFPSGHTTQATAAWGILCVLACVGRRPKPKGALACTAALIVLLVAASRFFLGVHWLSDVLAGVSLGVTILALWGIARVTVLNDRAGADREDTEAPRGERSRRIP